ncbi:hypothetical protein F5Y00DRAFT_264178 [Daldinia vernicosa]|uniref:uncharacterized protein n=1 Tax=Daldinia vernicosa TaxID=114800 RepID=UPI002007C925|nr:uncharacterized protein F5Y00DRAFT_264178 [Daldinia vernicosa]KAI0846766.1 hypothetical protein F5Y00DRAFT_264178 [Daldinia vernicosa]
MPYSKLSLHGFKVAGGYDFVDDGNWPSEEKQPDDDPLDVFGHGTHVAGIVAAKADSLTQIANGNYTWRFATLRPFGDPTVSEDS